MKKVLLKLGISLSLALATNVAMAERMFMLDNNNQIWIMTDVNNTSSVDGPHTLSGMGSGQEMMCMDYNPRDGKLYLLGYNHNTSTAQLYWINTTNWSANTIGSSNTSMDFNDNESLSLDFNAMLDNTIRITGSDGNGYWMDANNGTMVGTSYSSMDYANGDVNSGSANIAAMTHSNSFYGSDANTMYGFDLSNGFIVRFDEDNESEVHSVGLSSIFLLGADGNIGMDSWYDESNHENNMYMTASTLLSGGAHLYSLNNSGIATDMGTVGSGNMTIRDIAMENMHEDNQPLDGHEMVGLTLNLRNLIWFDSEHPDRIRDVKHINGMASGEKMMAIDYRPSDGHMYGLGWNESNQQSHLYRIDYDNTSSIATAVMIGASNNIDLGSSDHHNMGFDFNPVSDRIRLVGYNGMNAQIDADNGTMTMDTSMSYAIGDINTGLMADMGAIAHTNSYDNANNTQLLGLDFTLGALVNFYSNGNGNGGSTNGTLNTMSGFNSSWMGTGNNMNGYMDVYYDQTTNANIGYVSSNNGGWGDEDENYSEMYEMNPTTGTTQAMGPVGPGVPMRDIAARTAAPTSVKNTLGKNSNAGLLVYPNPVSSATRIELPRPAAANVTVAIVDVVGRAVKTYNYAPGNFILNVDMSGLAEGVYTLKVTEPGKDVQNIKVNKIN